jgi:hypothetical protein
MPSGREAIQFLSGCHRAWCSRFPDLQQRGQWDIVLHLCTQGRSGLPASDVQGMVRQYLLLDDATVRERIARLVSLHYCDLDPPGVQSARTRVIPTPSLLAQFDALLEDMGAALAEAANVVAPDIGFAAPTRMAREHGVAILTALSSTRRFWFEAVEQLFTVRRLSPARVLEARRHLRGGAHWLLVHLALEHAVGVTTLDVDRDGILADRLAAELIQVNGQNFQTTRDHIAELIELGLLERRPGRALHVALARAAAECFFETMAVAQASLPGWAAPLSVGPEDTAEASADPDMTLNRHPATPLPIGTQHALRVIAPAPERRRIPIEVSSLVIGRAPGGGATLALRSQDVSRRHCRIDIGPQGAVLTDLGSTNGTLLDGARLTAPVRLVPGARLTIGTFVLEYEGEIAGTGSRID